MKSVCKKFNQHKHAQQGQCGATPRHSVHGHAGEIDVALLLLLSSPAAASDRRMVAASSGCSALTRAMLAPQSCRCKLRS